jgi:hypothetical protein
MSTSRIRWSEAVPSQNGRPHRLVRTVIALVVLLPCMYGFCTKFWELVVICRGDMTGAFAIAPIVNYLLASAGFLLLLGWAAANGMFHDIEQPKVTLLEHERMLDER